MPNWSSAVTLTPTVVPTSPPADATILLTGDRAECLRRFSARIERTLAPRDVHVIEQTDDLYRGLAAEEPDRYVICDTTGWSPQETARAVEQAVRTRLTEREAAHAA